MKSALAINTTRFTIDGSAALEAQLAATCSRVLSAVQSIVPARKLQALVLGGGYGRGEGGVLKTLEVDKPYNDLEFYLFLRGNRLLNARKYGRALNQLGEGLSPLAGLHVEFKIDSLQKLTQSSISMFSYDLVSAHRIVLGCDDFFEHCQHHLNAPRIPAVEATRLLFNRCTGLLLAREILERRIISTEDADFVGRNLAKAKLALGDALLAVFGQYHWSCLERDQRLQRLEPSETLPSMARIRKHHATGVAFKLHPTRIFKPWDSFSEEHREISELASELWLWVESRRLKRKFNSVHDYIFHSAAKCPQAAPGRNFLLNLRSFGLGSVLDPITWRYPRERLFNTLPLLLWNGELSTHPELKRHLQRQLQTDASDWTGWVSAYKEVWPSYG